MVTGTVTLTLGLPVVESRQDIDMALDRLECGQRG